MFHVSLRRMYILLLLDEVFYKCQLGPVDWWCCLVQPYPGRFSACWICQLPAVVVLKSLTTRGDSSISLSLYHSSLHTVWADTVRHIHIRVATSSRTLPLPLLQYLFSPLMIVLSLNLLLLKSISILLNMLWNVPCKQLKWRIYLVGLMDQES